MVEEVCLGCKETAKEVRILEDKIADFRREYNEELSNYKVSKALNDRTLDSINEKLAEFVKEHQRLSNRVTSHMDDEEVKFELITKHITDTNLSLIKLNTTLKHLATKEDLEKTNGRVTTMWVIGAVIVSLILAVSAFFIKEGFTSSIESSSKANYRGLKKVIEKQVKGERLEQIL